MLFLRGKGKTELESSPRLDSFVPVSCGSCGSWFENSSRCITRFFGGFRFALPALRVFPQPFPTRPVSPRIPTGFSLLAQGCGTPLPWEKTPAPPLFTLKGLRPVSVVDATPLG